MEVRLLTDAVEFNDIAESWLSSDPFSTSILAGMLNGILAGTRGQPAGTRWIVVLDDGNVVGVAMHTPPYHPFLPRLPAGAAAAVASVLLATGQEFTGVTGEAASVTEFADSWAARTGGSSSVAMSMRMYRLGTLTPPVGIPGCPRRIELSDIELVADWFGRFHAEANPHSPAEDPTITAARRIATDQLWVWERDHRPVSLAVGTMPVAGVATIAPVYTPPEHRGCGYGAAVTAQATRACVDAGARHVVLYTDLANPTSNSIYQQIGYVPDHEAQERQLHPDTANASTVAHAGAAPAAGTRGTTSGSDRIVVVESDPAWAETAAALIAELQSALPHMWEQLEHIGSTSVPELAAKPVIDLMASTPHLGRVVQVENDALKPLGYTRMETGMSGRLCYRREPGTAPVRTVAVHLHVVPTNSWATQNQRLLRDHLLLHPEGAARYGDLKRRLAGEIDDPLAYTRAKTALIQELVDRARSDRGLPQVNVWPE